MTDSSAASRRVTTIRCAVGIIFVLAGLVKFLMPAPGAGLDGGPRGFGQALALMGVPFPTLFGYLVPTLECVGGLGLITNYGLRLWAILLAGDMLIAIVLVGLPGFRGDPLRIGSFTIGAELWRLPLEIGLLLALVWLMVQDVRDKLKS